MKEFVPKPIKERQIYSEIDKLINEYYEMYETNKKIDDYIEKIDDRNSLKLTTIKNDMQKILRR